MSEELAREKPLPIPPGAGIVSTREKCVARMKRKKLAKVQPYKAGAACLGKQVKVIPPAVKTTVQVEAYNRAIAIAALDDETTLEQWLMVDVLPQTQDLPEEDRIQIEAKVKQCVIFLKTLESNSLDIETACKASGLQRAKIPKMERAWAKFRLAMVEVRTRVMEGLEAAIIRRARDGWKNPVVSNGQIIGEKTEHDGKLAQFILEGNMGRYKRDGGMSVGTVINFEITGVALPPSSVKSELPKERAALDVDVKEIFTDE